MKGSDEVEKVSSSRWNEEVGRRWSLSLVKLKITESERMMGDDDSVSRCITGSGVAFSGHD